MRLIHLLYHYFYHFYKKFELADELHMHTSFSVGAIFGFVAFSLIDIFIVFCTDISFNKKYYGYLVLLLILAVHFGTKSRSPYFIEHPVLILNSKKISGFIVVLIMLFSLFCIGFAAVVTRHHIECKS